jgi:hypothetical protein
MRSSEGTRIGSEIEGRAANGKEMAGMVAKTAIVAGVRPDWSTLTDDGRANATLAHRILAHGEDGGAEARQSQDLEGPRDTGENAWWGIP